MCIWDGSIADVMSLFEVVSGLCEPALELLF